MPPAFSDSRKNRRPVAVVLEALDHPVARSCAVAAVQEQHLAAEGLLQVALQHVAHLGELGEDQRAFARREHFLQHFGQPGQLAGAAGDRAIVAQELRRVVADLLQLRSASPAPVPCAGCPRLAPAPDARPSTTAA